MLVGMLMMRYSTVPIQKLPPFPLDVNVTFSWKKNLIRNIIKQHQVKWFWISTSSSFLIFYSPFSYEACLVKSSKLMESLPPANKQRRILIIVYKRSRNIVLSWSMVLCYWWGGIHNGIGSIQCLNEQKQTLHELISLSGELWIDRPTACISCFLY